MEWGEMGYEREARMQRDIKDTASHFNTPLFQSDTHSTVKYVSSIGERHDRITIFQSRVYNILYNIYPLLLGDAPSEGSRGSGNTR